MRFQAKPFAVEVKRNRKNTTRPLLIDTTPQALAEPPPTAARALAESLFGNFVENNEPSSRAGQDRADRPPSSSNAESPETASDAGLAPARRILPDLRRDLSKVEAEEEAPVRSPTRVPRARRPRAMAIEFAPSSGDDFEPAARKAPAPKKPQAKPQRGAARVAGPIASAPAMPKPVSKIEVKSLPSTPPRQPSKPRSRKAAEGTVGAGLRRGERWKRRLPRVLW
jgi:hypothetical protein